MAYRDRSSNQSSYGDTQRYSQPVSSLFDKMQSSQHGWQGEGYSSHVSSTSMYERGCHSQSFNESHHNQYSSKSSPCLGSATASGQVSRGSPDESAQRSGYQSQKRISHLIDFPSANQHNQFGSPYERNYQQSEHNQSKQTFWPSYDKIEYGRNQQSYQERGNPPFEQDYQERGNPPFEQDYQSTRSGNYNATQVTDRFKHPTSDLTNYNNKNFQHKSYSSYKTSHQVSFESGNQMPGLQNNQSFSSTDAKLTEDEFDSEKAAEQAVKSRGWFKSRGNQMPGPQNNQSFSSEDAKRRVKPEEHNPELLKCREKGLLSEEHNKDEDNEFDSVKEAEQAVNINPLNIYGVLCEKYKFYPPTAEEMGSIFKGMVIFFAHRFTKSKANDILFDVIFDSFIKSAQFHDLQDEYGCDVSDMFRICTLRYDGMMMARSVNLRMREARVWASVELINKLAMTCYTLKIRETYFTPECYQSFLKTNECPGVFRVVPDKDVPDFVSAFNYIANFFNKEDSDCELVFTNPMIFDALLSFAKEDRQFDAHVFSSVLTGTFKPIAVFRRRTPQYWRDKILASGKMENEKYILIPPQGLGFLEWNRYRDRFENQIEILSIEIEKFWYRPITN